MAPLSFTCGIGAFNIVKYYVLRTRRTLMPRYDKKCNICGYEKEMWLPLNHLPQGCCNPEIDHCSGVMETIIKVAPALTRAACPSRTGYNKGVSYTVKDKSE